MNTSSKTVNLALVAIILVTIIVAAIMLMSSDDASHTDDHEAGHDRDR